MPKFDAGSAVEPMEYDFTKFGGGQGEIPEPSTGQVDAFFSGMRDTIKALKEEVKDKTGMDLTDLPDTDGEIEDQETQAKIVSALEKMDNSMLQSQQDRFGSLLAALCSGKPSQEDFRKLPFRVFSEFQKWIISEIRPNQGAAVTKK